MIDSALSASLGATATIEYERDPANPGRTAYRITGPNRRVVEAAIERRQRDAEQAPYGGYARFTTPKPLPDGRWGALGEVVIGQASPALAEAAE